jgi:hypothetical protein
LNHNGTHEPSACWAVCNIARLSLALSVRLAAARKAAGSQTLTLPAWAGYPAFLSNNSFVQPQRRNLRPYLKSQEPADPGGHRGTGQFGAPDDKF